MELKPGFKPSELGPVPVTWEVQPLGALASIGSGGTPRRDIPAYWGGEIPWVTTSQIDFNRICEAEQFISEAGLNNSAAKLLPPGTLLMALYGQGKTRGKVAQLAIEASTNQACASIIVGDSIYGEYLLHFLSSRYEAIRNSSNSGGQENLSGQIVKALPVAVPPMAEQRAIAAALGDVDALLASLDKVIAKKRDLKQAAMQQLLTGQTRLPGFSGSWQTKPLGAIAPLQRGFDLPTSQVQRGRYPVVYSNGILNHHAHFQVRGPGVVTGRSGTIGKVTFVAEDYWPHNTALWVTNFKGSDPRFIYYLYGAIGFDRFATGSGVPTLNRNDVHAFRVAVPEPPEQRSIAAVLSDMDAELVALETRREKTRAIKQGMMQELLSGRTRLV